VGLVVVEYEVHVEVSGHLAVDLPQKAEELLRAVVFVEAPDDAPRFDVESREEGRRAVTNVIVSALFAVPWLHRQERLCTVESLNLGLFATQSTSAFSGGSR
jgi:hypothetical protein